MVLQNLVNRHINLLENQFAKKADEIFSGVSYGFVEYNWRWCHLIIETFQKFLQQHPEYTNKIKEHTLYARTDVAASYSECEKAFTFNFSHPELVESDVIWTIYHELGHFIDFDEGKILMTDDEIIFDDVSISKEDYIRLRDDKNNIFPYHHINFEASANNFAYLNCTTPPDDKYLLAGYQVAAKLYNDRNQGDLFSAS